MTTKINQHEINGILWKACDTFRGAVDASEYKNYILVMLFVKYISDVWKEHYDALVEKLRSRGLVERGAYGWRRATAAQTQIAQ